MGVKFASRVTEKTADGIVNTVVLTGTKAEMTAMLKEQAMGTVTDDGKLKSARVYQESPLIWCCERKYSTDANGEQKDAPSTEYGKKSAQLKGSMLSMQLECHENYLTRWNHYLMAEAGTTAIPAWWSTATDAVLTNEDSQKYAWIKSLGETPADKSGRWHVLKNPKKPGIDSYDLATYSVTETARFRSAAAAGRMVANCLNKIGSPNEDFGMKAGNWKCDDASVFYDGDDWFATLTWTLSGNSAGWDRELYS